MYFGVVPSTNADYAAGHAARYTTAALSGANGNDVLSGLFGDTYGHSLTRVVALPVSQATQSAVYAIPVTDLLPTHTDDDNIGVAYSTYLR